MPVPSDVAGSFVSSIVVQMDSFWTTAFSEGHVAHVILQAKRQNVFLTASLAKPRSNAEAILWT